MKVKKGPTILGFFVFGAIIVFILSIFFFLSRNYLELSREYVVFFKGSLKNLQIGSPVMYRGIRIGQVTNIKVNFDERSDRITIPVYFRLFRARTQEFESAPMMKRLIRGGMKAELENINIITAAVGVDLVMKRDQPGVVRKVDGKIVIPSISNTEDKKSLDDVLRAADETFKAITAFVQSDKVKQTLYKADLALQNANELFTNVNEQVDPVSHNANQAFEAFNRAANSVRNLSDYLARHPEALITGKKR